jgi:hypothetical protein
MAGIGAKELMRTPSGRLSCRSLAIGPLSALEPTVATGRSLTKAIAARCYPDFLRLPRIGPREERDSAFCRKSAGLCPLARNWSVRPDRPGELDHPLWALLPRKWLP